MTDQKEKDGTAYTIPAFPLPVYCPSLPQEGVENFSSTKPNAERCPYCKKPFGTRKNQCNFTIGK